jgi:spore coat protein H
MRPRSMLTALALTACPHHGLTIEPRDTGPSDDPDDTAVAETCLPVMTTSEPYFLEGEELVLDFACSADGDRSDFEASIANLPEGASFDPESWSVRWTPALDQGGRYDLLLAVRPAYGEGGFPETTVGTLWVADAIDHPQNLPVDPTIYTEEWGLPVLHLDPQQRVGEEHVPAIITVEGHSYQAEMKVRGAVSVGYPKQSYTLRFSEEDLDASSWGMGNKDHLYAITPFDDNSYVRQKLCYDLWIAMAEHWGAERLTPRTFFGVVYLSGEYHGLYLFSDRPDDHFAQEMGLSREGNLYKSVNHYANFYRTYGGTPKSSLHEGYEKKDGTPEHGEEGAYWDLEALVAWSADASDQQFWAEHTEWLRLNEFMDWFLFVHWTSSDDSAGKNAYLYNDPAAFEFRYCPWDFNHSFGQGWYTYRIESDVYNDFQSHNGVFAHIQNHPEASAELWDRHRELMDDGPLNATWLLTTLEAYEAEIQRSADRDWAVWGSSFQSYWGEHNPNDFHSEQRYLRRWIVERDEYMRSVHP